MTAPNTACAPDLMEIRLHGIVKESITDGPGIRFTVFTQGCPHQCDGCHNPASHSFTDGFLRATRELTAEMLANPLLDGVTFSGGEPFMQAAECASMAASARNAGLHIMVFTGYTWEELLIESAFRKGWRQLLELTDILIEGRFEKTERSLDLRFRGSRNQRAIDVQASLRDGTVVLADL